MGLHVLDLLKVALGQRSNNTEKGDRKGAKGEVQERRGAFGWTYLGGGDRVVLKKENFMRTPFYPLHA